MKTSQLLRDIELGSDVAESDEDLRKYFIQTHTFREVIHDESDLILGPKGSGKTAIFRMLAEPTFDIPAISDTIIIPAFNVQGSVFFRDLPPAAARDETALRALWTAYILSLVGSYLIENYPESAEKRQLYSELKSAGLLPKDASTRGVWQSVLAPFRRLLEPRSIEARVDLGPGLPGVEGKAEYDAVAAAEPGAKLSQEKPAWMRRDFDADAITEQMLRILKGSASRCWVIFDRLDEAFDDVVEERVALRGLMRAQADLSSYNAALRVKLFLRSDIMDRLTKESGFVNMTHFRSLRISWSRQQMIDMIVSRLCDSDLFLTFLIDREISTKDAAIRAMFSSVIEGGNKGRGRRGETNEVRPLVFILERTLDATAEFNPRNVVSFLREARRFELARCQTMDPPVSRRGPVVTQDSMVRAWRQVSERRLTDTLYAEFNSIRPAVEKFRNGPQRFDKEYLAKALDFPLGSDELDAITSQLEYCGFMKLQGRTTYRVGELYRPALGLNPKWQDRRQPRR